MGNRNGGVLHAVSPCWSSCCTGGFVIPPTKPVTWRTSASCGCSMSLFG